MERRRRCVHPAPILPYSGDVMRLGRPCVVGAGQVAPTPRIRPREVQRCGGSEAHGASKSRPSNLKLALVAYWYGPAVCAESSRQIRHIRMVNARPGARMRLTKAGNIGVLPLYYLLKHRAASAGLFATAGEPASCMLLVTCMRDGRIPQAAAGLRLERPAPVAGACAYMVIAAI
jgi:hypothetical protein